MKLAAFLIMPYLALGTALLTAFVIYPKLRLSQYRYELWRLRDSLLDDVASGRITDLDAAVEGVELLETLIVHADAMNLSNGIAALWAFRHDATLRMSAAVADDEVVMESAGLNAALEPAVRRYVLAARDAGVQQLRRGSVFACGFGLLAAAGRPVAVVGGSKRVVQRSLMGTELVEHALALNSGSRSTDRLAAAYG